MSAYRSKESGIAGRAISLGVLATCRCLCQAFGGEGTGEVHSNTELIQGEFESRYKGYKWFTVSVGGRAEDRSDGRGLWAGG